MMNKRLLAITFINIMCTSSFGYAESSAINYQRDINEQIAEAIYYPAVARNTESEGVVGIAVAFGKGGSIAHVIVEQSSGVPSLDEAAVSAVRAAAPFSQLPADVAEFHTKLKYVLKYTTAN